MVLDQIIAGSAFIKPSALLSRSSVHSCLSSIRVGSGWRQADGQGLVLARLDEWGEGSVRVRENISSLSLLPPPSLHLTRSNTPLRVNPGQH